MISNPAPILLLSLAPGAELPEQRWEITDEVSIGRLEDCEVSLPHKSVSRRHARIVPTGTGYEIEDLGSVNGTWVNDRAISDRAPLDDGDQVMIGDVPLLIQLRRPRPVAPPPTAGVTPPPPPAPAPSPAPAPAPAPPPPLPIRPAPSPQRARDDTPPSRIDLPQPPSVDVPSSSGVPVEYDDHPTIIGEVEPTPAPAPPPVPPAPVVPTPQTVAPPLAQPPPAPPPTQQEELTAAGMIELAERLSTALRLLKGDVARARWLYEHAGGQAAARAFVEQVQRVQADNAGPQEIGKLLELAPSAAHLLDASILLLNAVSSLDPPNRTQDELKADAADLQPIARP